MITQKLWQIKYNNEILVYRNSYGKTKRYDINKLTITDGSRVTKILLDGKKVIEWDTLIMNIEEDVQISKFFASRTRN